MADSAAHGKGFLNQGQKTPFPPGYPAVLALMLKAGVAHSWTIIGLNLLCLGAGVYAVYELLVRQFNETETVALSICCLFLLSYVVIKHFTIALTDVPYFCCGMVCLTLLGRASKLPVNRKWLFAMASAVFFAALAITVRRIGMALLPALLVGVIANPFFRRRVKELPTWAKAMGWLVIAVVFVAAGALIKTTSTLWDFVENTKGISLWKVAQTNLSYRLTELGELTLNLPAAKIPPAIPPVFVQLIGALLLLLVVGGLLVRFRVGTTEAYFVSYMAILFAWPFYDARFWLPVIPLVIVYSFAALRAIRFPKAGTLVYCGLFTVFGIFAIGYSTRITFAGSRFADLYGDGSLSRTYCEAFHSCAQEAPDAKQIGVIDPKALHLLKEFQ
jgi:hypothetical protein